MPEALVGEKISQDLPVFKRRCAGLMESEIVG
jgi:hypothetical protein